MRHDDRGSATGILPVGLKQNTAVLLKLCSSAVIFSTLTACGGGGGGGGTPPQAPVASTTTVSGQVTDGVFPGASVEIRSGSVTGTPLGTATADGQGKYQITFPTPTGTSPVFLTATKSDGTATLASYIGAENQLTGTLTSANLPDLNVTHVTTSALALIQQNGINLAALTPAQYGQQVMQLNNAIIQLSGIVKDLVDQRDTGCALVAPNPIDLNTLSGMVGSTPVNSTSNLYTTVVSRLNSSCLPATMADLSNQIVADTQILGPELTETAATAGTANNVAPGTYSGLVTPLVTSAIPANACTIGTAASLTAVMTVASNGAISLTSTSGPINIAGNLTGANFTMSGTDSGPLQVTGALVPLAATSVSNGGSGFSINGTWTNTSGGCTYSGTYYVPSMLSSGSLPTATSSNIPSGTYQNVTMQPMMLTNSTGQLSAISPSTATVVINNGTTIAYTASNGDTGTGIITGNTFTMTINANACGGSNTVVATGTMYLGTTGLLINGSYSESAAACPAQTGTFSGSS